MQEFIFIKYFKYKLFIFLYVIQYLLIKQKLVKTMTIL